MKSVWNMLVRVCVLLFCSTGILFSAQEPNIRAVVFDVGGVLIQVDRQRMMQFLMESFDVDAAEMRSALFAMRTQVTSNFSEEQFWKQYAASVGVMLPLNWLQKFHEVIHASISDTPGMKALVKQLQAKGVTTAILSNVTQVQAHLLRKIGCYELFNPVLLSCDLGVEKPDPAIYHKLLQELHVSASQVMFIDDRPENVDSAKKCGIDAIVFIDAGHLSEEFHKRGIL